MFGERVAVDALDLHVPRGEIFGLLGHNGAGKTTLLRAIMGELPHTGQLTFMSAHNPTQRQRPRIGYVPQRIEIDKSAPLTVLDLFASAGTSWPIWLWYPKRVRDGAREALACVGAEELIERRLGNLSCGQLQRVLLALALKPVPELLLLDEPLAGLDHAGTAQFYEIVSGLRRFMDLSILLVSHDLNAAAAIADRMVFINNQSLAHEGTPAEVLQHPEVRSAFGLDMQFRNDLPGSTAALCPVNIGDQP